MPSVQRGSAVKRGRKWAARWYDENGKPQFRGGFETKTAAREWLEAKVSEVLSVRRGDPVAIRRRQLPTFSQLVEEYLGQHVGEENTKRALRERLRYARDAWGDLRIDRVNARDIAAWRARLPERSAWGITKALRAVLNYAVRVGLLDKNPATAVPNPEPKRREVPFFPSPAEVEAVAAEVGSPIPIFAAWTGLRPEEWIALERADVDRHANVVHVRRVFTDGQLKGYGKSEKSLRTVPLPRRAAESLNELPPRIDTPLLFPAVRGGYLNLNTWRRRAWTPAIRAAGLAHRPPYALRHTYAAWAIAAGIASSSSPA